MQSILVMEDMSPLDKLPENDKYAVLIKNGTFAWDKLEKERDEGEDDEDGDKIRMKGDEVPAITAGVSAVQAGMDIPELEEIIRKAKIHNKNPYDSELIAPVLFGINLKLEKVNDKFYFICRILIEMWEK